MASFAGLGSMSPAGAATTSVGPIDFESGYTAGNINAQNGWSKTGGYDVAVATVGTFPDASAYGFQTQALRASNAVADGAFGGQAFSPGLSDPTGEDVAARYFTASFKIGTTKAEWQPGLAISVSPDDGHGGRMSYLRFDDELGGVHVSFDDTTDATLGTVADFNETDIATLDRAHAHTIKFDIAFVDGPGTAGAGNDVVKIFVDGELKHTGTTWENYYRYDPEQAGGGNVVPTTSKVLFASRGTSNSTVAGQGYLIDRVALTSSTTAPVVTPPTAPGTPYDGNRTCADLAPAGVTWKEFKIEGVPDDGTHADPNSNLVITISNGSDQTIDWASNLDVSAVLVKGGNGGIEYSYPGQNDTSDTGLHALVQNEATHNYHGISHVNFCFRAGGDQAPPGGNTPPPGGETPQPGTPQPGTPQPGNPQSGNPQSGNPQVAPAVQTTPAAVPGTQVLGVTLTQDATLPRTGAAGTRPLALAGGLGLFLGLAMLMLGYRKTAVEHG